MKIAFALGHELPFPASRGGGVNSLLEHLCLALVAEGHAVTAYSPLGEGRPARETIAGIKHVRLRGAERDPRHLMNAIRGLPYVFALRQALEPCDVLSCHFLHSFLFASLKRARVITHTLHRDPKRFTKIYGGLDRIYAGSEAVSDQARQIAPALAPKVRTVHNCIDFAGYPPPTPEVSADPRFLFVGRFSRDKGVDILIRAFAAAVKEGTRARLSLVGPIEAKDGGEESLVAECRAFIAQQGVGAQIEIEPPIFDRARLEARVREGDVICLPSVRGETLNMSSIESMRLGKALLISDLSANAPLVREGFNGCFAKTGDIADWTAKIKQLAADRAKIAELSVNSYRYGLDHFSAPKIAREYVADFESLLQTSRR